MGVHENSIERAERFGDREAQSSRDYQGASMRGVARSLLLTMMATMGALGEGAGGPLEQPRVQILVMHHVFDDEVPRFRKLLKRLAQRHEFISYSEAVNRITTRRTERPAIAFSFDDGLANCRTAAAILQEHGARGCFFVVPSMVGVRNRESIRRFCVGRLRSPAVPLLGWDEVDGLLAQGHEIGSHTWSHRDLGAIGDDEVAEEIGLARSELLRRIGHASHFAWPYGTLANFSAHAVRTAFDMGHVSVASAIRGCYLPASASDSVAPLVRPCLRRDNIQASWPWPHIRWFLARASREAIAGAAARNGDWPGDWATTSSVPAVETARSPRFASPAPAPNRHLETNRLGPPSTLRDRVVT